MSRLEMRSERILSEPERKRTRSSSGRDSAALCRHDRGTTDQSRRLATRKLPIRKLPINEPLMSSSTQLVTLKTSQSRNIKVFAVFLLLLSTSEFVIRGPVRYFKGPSEWNDFSQNYTASKLWLRGKSPANPTNFVALWKEQTKVGMGTNDIRTRLAPPLGGLVVMAPVAVFAWRPAKILWLCILLLSFAVTVAVFVRLLGRPWNSADSLLLAAGCLALAPFHTGIANGNSSILVIALCALAIWEATQQRDTSAGLIFGIACSIKPQLGAFLVLYYLVLLRWRLFSVALGCTTVLNLVAALYLRVRGTPWFEEYLHNAAGFATKNNIDSFASDNLGRFSLINLQVPFFSITQNSVSANVWAFVITAVLVCSWLILVFKNRQESELLALATISTVALLPVYHRAYDAGVLALSLCWCTAQAFGEYKTFAKSGLLLMLPFLFPGSAYLQKLGVQGQLPESVTHSSVWECLILPHETWALLLLSCVLLGAMSASRKSSSEILHHLGS